MSRPVLYFISETVPANTHASSVIFYRHFRRLETEGYRIVWVTDQNSFDYFGAHFPAEWELILLPNRSLLLPPYQPTGVLQQYRFNYYYRRYLRTRLSGGEKAVLITYLNGMFLAPFAAFVKRKSGLPLACFFHDGILELNFFKHKPTLAVNAGKVIAASDVVFIATEELASGWERFNKKFQLLYPIPAAYAKHGAPAPVPAQLTIGYSGAVYDEIVPCLDLLAAQFQKAGHRLVIVGDKDKTATIAAKYPDTVICKDLFATAEEASDYLVANCTATLISYPMDPGIMPWIINCFPSKFLQYCQLGLPTLIFAPRASAIGKWCEKHGWPLYADDYMPESLGRLVRALGSADINRLVLELKQTDFDPGKIHRRLSVTLKEMTDARSAGN